MANSVCCSAHSGDCPRPPLVRSEKRAARRNMVIRLLLEWPARSGRHCSKPATSLVRTARVDAESLPPRRGGRFVFDRVGIGDCRLALASFALLPEPCERVTESDQ